MNGQILQSRVLQHQAARHLHATGHCMWLYRVYRDIKLNLGDFLLKNISRNTFSILKRQLLPYFLVIVLIFQSAYAFPQANQPDNPVPNTDALNQINEHSLESLSQLEYLESYDPNVPVRINDGSFSLMPGIYEGPFNSQMNTISLTPN